MKIHHEKLGELKINYDYGLSIEINDKQIAFEIQDLGKEICVARFKSKQIIQGKQIEGLKLTRSQYRSVLTYKNEMIEKEKNEYYKNKLEEYKKTKGFRWGIDGIYVPYIPNFEYPCVVLEKAEKIIKERYEYSIETVKTTAGNVGETVVKNITGAEILKILDELLDEFEKNRKMKIEQSKKQEEKRIKELKEKAKQTGERQVVSVTSDDCDDENEACDIDTITEYVNPDGTYTIDRTHNW